MDNEFKFCIDRLRFAGLRPTKQRLIISKLLFERSKTFHFTIEQLKNIVEKNSRKKISVATLYNTVHAFKKRGYLKEISLKGNKSFFDTNTKNHHHFYDEHNGTLIDIKNEEISLNKFPEPPTGKHIKEIEVTLSIDSNSQIQKKK